MMKYKVLYWVSLIIMIMALLFMSINWLIVSFPDWAVRMIGLVVLVDISILSYSTIRMKQEHNV